jgi:hypothetical protein
MPEVWRLFHTLWGDSAAHTYHKAEWIRFQALLSNVEAALLPRRARALSIVHLLYAGSALCKTGTPDLWPVGETFVAFHDTAHLPHVNCHDCLEVLARQVVARG